MRQGFMIILLFLFTVSIAAAHTGLESSTPEEDDTVTYSVSKITLRFDTAVEPSSEATVTDNSGTVIEISETLIDKNIMTVKFTDSLPSGTYDVVWNIVGEDGHIIEDTYEFTVDAGEVVEPSDDPNSADEEPIVETTTENPESGAVTDETEEGNLVPVAAGVMGITVIVAGFFFLRRKKNDV